MFLPPPELIARFQSMIDRHPYVSPKFGLLIFFRQSMVSSTLENRDPGCDRWTMERPRIFAVFAGSRSTGMNSGLTHSLAMRFTGCSRIRSFFRSQYIFLPSRKLRVAITTATA